MKKQSMAKLFWDQVIKQLLVFVAAIWFMFEEWIWDSIMAVMKKIASYKIVARIEAAISNSNRYTILLMFMVPGCIMFPAKLYSLYLISIGEKFMGASLFILIKIIGTAIATRLFTIGKDKLLTIPIFKWGYDKVIMIKTFLMDKLNQMEFWQKAKKLVKQTKENLKNFKEELKKKFLIIRDKLGKSRFNLMTKFKAYKRMKQSNQ